MKPYKVLYVLLFILGYSCAHDSAEPFVTCNPPDTVSFSTDILPILNAECNTSGCHSGTLPGVNLNLEPCHAFTELMKPGSGYIDTVNPKYSVLYAQMNSTSYPMPPTGKLDKCRIDLVLKWIRQKAKNN